MGGGSGKQSREYRKRERERDRQTDRQPDRQTTTPTILILGRVNEANKDHGLK